jgi:hypothetical protein
MTYIHEGISVFSEGGENMRYTSGASLKETIHPVRLRKFMSPFLSVKKAAYSDVEYSKVSYV